MDPHTFSEGKTAPSWGLHKSSLRPHRTSEVMWIHRDSCLHYNRKKTCGPAASQRRPSIPKTSRWFSSTPRVLTILCANEIEVYGHSPYTLQGVYGHSLSESACVVKAVQRVHGNTLKLRFTHDETARLQCLQSSRRGRD